MEKSARYDDANSDTADRDRPLLLEEIEEGTKLKYEFLQYEIL